MSSISLFLYNIIIGVFHASIRIAALFKPKAKKWVNGRHNWEANLREKLSFPEQPIWIHCASLGEFEQGRPLIEAIKKKQPETKILLTFYSPSGFEIRKTYPLADAIVYLPPDGKKNAEKFLKIVNPKMAIFVKYEFWYHYLTTLKKEQLPTYLASAIFRKSQPFFKWYGGLHREMLGCFEHIFLQDEASYELLMSLLPTMQKNADLLSFSNLVSLKNNTRTSNSVSLKNSTQTSNLKNKAGDAPALRLTKFKKLSKSDVSNPSFSVAGDTRIDRVIAIQPENKSLPIIEQFCGKNSNIFVCGSTWETDEDLLIPFINNSLSNNYKTIIAPHEINISHISAIQQKLTVPSITYSQAKKSGTGNAQVLLIDNIGMLAHLYRFGKIAYIGGGFGSGIHNTLEPIAFGLPVIFGTKFRKFPEAVNLVENGGAFSIKNEANLKVVFDRLQNEKFYQNTSEETKKYLRKNMGATERVMKGLF